MKLPSAQLEAFNEVCRIKNFTKAAKSLGLTQSALSQRIMKLEETLETTLIIRERAGMQLTPAGYQLLRYCQTTESLENELISQMTPEHSAELVGTIRIAGFSSIMASVVIPLFAKVLKANPKLRMVFLARELDDLPDMLKRGEVDFILMDIKVEKNEWVTELIGFEENVLVEKNGYKGPNVFLENDENELTTRQYFALKDHKKREVYSSHYVDDIYGILAGLREGVARAILPKHLIRQEKGLKELRPGIELKVPVILHYVEQNHYSALHKLVVSTLIDDFHKVIGSESGRK
jgi:DNA-binding transcriptional LysR family regulator